jgi:hypothetical protein
LQGSASSSAVTDAGRSKPPARPPAADVTPLCRAVIMVVTSTSIATTIAPDTRRAGVHAFVIPGRYPRLLEPAVLHGLLRCWPRPHRRKRWILSDTRHALGDSAKAATSFSCKMEVARSPLACTAGGKAYRPVILGIGADPGHHAPAPSQKSRRPESNHHMAPGRNPIHLL